MRKEYNNRWQAPLVNDKVTQDQLSKLSDADRELIAQFEAMLARSDEEQKAFFAKVEERSKASGLNK